ncbi:MAG TPA: hypothetical protein VK427_25030, partial [Kofleriaceae bacterium]|nr:hypothetical protein [Kofleriaceae bacterium]
MLKHVLVLVLAASPARAERVVAVTPLTAVGAEDTSTSTRQIAAQLEAAIATLPNTKVITTGAVSEAVKRSNKPALRSCENEPTCLAE